MSSAPRPARAVESWPCQSVCLWDVTAEVWVDPVSGALRVFRCVGCGSEWVRTEAWTPVDGGGLVPPEVLAERDAG